MYLKTASNSPFYRDRRQKLNAKLNKMTNLQVFKEIFSAKIYKTLHKTIKTLRPNQNFLRLTL